MLNFSNQIVIMELRLWFLVKILITKQAEWVLEEARETFPEPLKLYRQLVHRLLAEPYLKLDQQSPCAAQSAGGHANKTFTKVNTCSVLQPPHT